MVPKTKILGAMEIDTKLYKSRPRKTRKTMKTIICLTILFTTNSFPVPNPDLLGIGKSCKDSDGIYRHDFCESKLCQNEFCVKSTGVVCANDDHCIDPEVGTTCVINQPSSVGRCEKVLADGTQIKDSSAGGMVESQNHETNSVPPEEPSDAADEEPDELAQKEQSEAAEEEPVEQAQEETCGDTDEICGKGKFCFKGECVRKFERDGLCQQSVECASGNCAYANPSDRRGKCS